MRHRIYHHPPTAARNEQPFFPLPKKTVQTKEDKAPFFQTKRATPDRFTLSQPGDSYERQADAMADQVVQRLSQPVPLVQTMCAECEEETVQKKAEEEEIMSDLQRREEEEEMAPKLQTKPEAGIHPSMLSGLSGWLAKTQGNGSVLPVATRLSMEGAFGVNFGRVRIHTNQEAVQMNQALHAQAFTHGNDIYFNQGKYNPASHTGKHLLAHELTHTIQQGSASRTPATAESGTVVQRSVLLPGRDDVCPPGYTICDFIHERITMEAQYALSHLYRQGGEDCKIALSILGGAENGELKGIYKEDQGQPALMARRNGSSWWLLVPEGQGAIVSALESPPMMVFEKRLANDHIALAEALKRAWQKSSLGARIILPSPPSMTSCTPAPEPPGEHLDLPPENIEGVRCSYPRCDPSIPFPCGNATECITVPGKTCGVCEGASKKAEECLEQNEKTHQKERKRCKDEYSPGKVFKNTAECMKAIAECYADKPGPGKVKSCIEAAGCFVDPKPVREYQECLDKESKRYNEQVESCKSLP